MTEDHEDLKSEIYWIYEAEVKGSFMPENILKINDFEIKAIKNKSGYLIPPYFLATLKIEEEDIDISQRIAEDKFAEIFGALSLVTGGNYEFNIKEGIPFSSFDGKEISGRNIIITIRAPMGRLLSDKVAIQLSEKIMKFLPLFHIEDAVFQNSYKYYLTGIMVSKWPIESFLNFFKAIELISAHFLDDLKNDFKEKIPDLTNTEINELCKTTKRRMIKTREILNVENIKESEIKEIVDKRPDAAHARTYQRIERVDVNLCKKIAREFIFKYLKLASMRSNS